MCEIEFGEEIPMFYTVGMLRDLLKNYPNDTPIYVSRTPGWFSYDEEGRWLNLTSIDDEIDDAPYGHGMFVTGEQEYMDF